MDDYAIGWAGKVMHWLRFAIALVMINLLFIAGTLAGLIVLGVFPAATAAAILLGRLRAGQPSDRLVRDFITAYRAQFWHLAVVAIPFQLATVLVFLDLVAFQTTAVAGSPVSAVLLVLLVVVSVGTLLAAFSAIVICTRYRDSARSIWRYAFVLPFVSPLLSLSLILALGALTLALFQFGVLVPLIGASAPLFVAGWLIDHRLAALDAAHPAHGAVRNEDGALSLAPSRRASPA
ncbi:putative membrane protein YesL [Cryobacterium sp. MP_3.1]|uniref:YesL family protein n=1 Tax=Cryobacterium sp. MP_3.1 TaxID=3071711 RepID=UPI002E0B196D|nr:putative membrane protein YesL [Cryobacterium sp. MP_3.1]